MTEFYKTIWRATGRQQLLLIVLSLAAAGLAAVPLDYQKSIINGMSEGVSFNHLLVLGIEMAAVILVSLTLKWVLGYRTGIVGESVTRLIRSTKVQDWASGNDAEADAGGSRRGTLANIISSESEAVGKFVGSAFSEPLLQLGTLVSVIGYIAFTQPTLGLIAFAMLAPQALAVYFTQQRINALVRKRVLILRESINTITHSELESIKQSVIDDFDQLYETRRSIFKWKLSVKLFLGIMNGAGLITVLVYGGWLVTQGQSDVGIVVAATIGLGRIQGPWKAVIDFFRNMSVVKVQYELLRDL